jgi:hypothetical protein
MRKVFALTLVISFFTLSAAIVNSQERARRIEPAAASSPSEQRTSAARETQEEVRDGDVLRVDTSPVTVPVSVRDRHG